MAITKKVELVHNAAYKGMVADLQLANRVSKLNATDETIPAGSAVMRDTADGSVKPMETGGTMVGVVVYELVDTTPQGDVIGIHAGKTGTVLTDGVIWVEAGEAVNAGDPVFAGVGTDVKGMFTKAAGSDATEAVAVTGAVWLDTTAKNHLGRISVHVGG